MCQAPVRRLSLKTTSEKFAVELPAASRWDYAPGIPLAFPESTQPTVTVSPGFASFQGVFYHVADNPLQQHPVSFQFNILRFQINLDITVPGNIMMFIQINDFF